MIRPEIAYAFLIWFIGFLLCLVTLIKYGKKMGLDYSNPTFDDYSSNAEAWFYFSLFWFFFTPIFLGIKFITSIINFIKIFTNETDS